MERKPKLPATQDAEHDPLDPHSVFLRKIEAGVEKEATFGNLILDVGMQSVANFKTLETMHLTEQEFKILHILTRGGDAPIETREIENYLYEDYPDEKDLPLTNTVSVQMAKLRKKLEKISKGTVTVVSGRRGGFGYKLELESGKEEA